MMKVVVIDIDGTVSKPGERLKFLEQSPPDWDSFYNDSFKDEPIQSVCDLVDILKGSYEIVFCTGRIERIREQTSRWLCLNVMGGWSFKLLMRPEGDKRHDTEVKPELLLKACISKDKVAFILEDRNSMVKKWRELGFKCFQVAEGDF